MKRFAPIVFVLCIGCADFRSSRGPIVVPLPAPADVHHYRIGCPDSLELTFVDRREWDAIVTVDVDGRISMGESGTIRVENLTATEASVEIGRAVNVDVDRLQLKVISYKAHRVYITGPDNKRTRTVPYRGPDFAVDFLLNAGAILPATTQLNDISIVRANVAEGKPSELFYVDVEAVILDGDPRTNVRIQPSDHIYVGETRRSSFSRLLPKWLRPFYRSLVGLWPMDAARSRVDG